MTTTNPETKKIKEIRRLIRKAINWHKMDNGMPHFYSSENYKFAKKHKGLVLKVDERDKFKFYYTRSSKAIEEIAKEIYKLVK
jgi:hypothetical protein